MTGPRRLLLRRLLRWQGFVDAPESVRARAWRRLTLAASPEHDGPGSTEQFSSALPQLPLPALADTLKTFVQSVEPLLDDAGRAEVRAAAAAFAASPAATRLQAQLLKRRATHDNWVTDYWEMCTYLLGRQSLLCSAGYAVDAATLPRPGITQTERAALLIRAVLMFRRRIDEGTVTPQRDQGIAPLCMQQLRRYFATVREPGTICDTLTHHAQSDCVVILANGHYFEVPVLLGEQRCDISYPALLAALDGIRRYADALPPGPPVAALTLLPRDQWAQIRTELLDAGGSNADSVRHIERCLLTITLDDAAPETLDQQARATLCGDGTNRWLDKSASIVVYANGRAGALMEHSWGDGESLTLGWEEMLLFERGASDVSAVPADSSPPWSHLDFDVAAGSRLDVAIGGALANARQLIGDADVFADEMTGVGAGAIKARRCSPDSFVQMAMQLAYARLHPDRAPCLTYQTATTRRFLRGRTECVRSTSAASIAFVSAVTENTCSRADQARLLRIAIEEHRAYRLRAQRGRGCDRHLFGLLVEAQLAGDDIEFFRTRAWQLGFELSTSQSPVRQTSAWTVDASCRGVGFLPTSPTGYGVSYAFVGDQVLNLFASAQLGCGQTSARLFADAVNQAAVDMLELLDDAATPSVGATSTRTPAARNGRRDRRDPQDKAIAAAAAPPP